MAAVCIIELLLLLSCNELSAPICKIWNSKKKLIHVSTFNVWSSVFFSMKYTYILNCIWSTSFTLSKWKMIFQRDVSYFCVLLKKKWYKMIERRPNFPIPTAAVDVIYCRLGMIIALLRMHTRAIISERSWMSCVPLRILVRILLLFRL